MLVEELHRSCQPLLELAGVTHMHWKLPGVGYMNWLCPGKVHMSWKLAVV